jgi:hypothetical protein
MAVKDALRGVTLAHTHCMVCLIVIMTQAIVCVNQICDFMAILAIDFDHKHIYNCN